MFNEFEVLLTDEEKAMTIEEINARLEQLNEKGQWRGLSASDSGEFNRLSARHEQLTGINWYDC